MYYTIIKIYFRFRRDEFAPRVLLVVVSFFFEDELFLLPPLKTTPDDDDTDVTTSIAFATAAVINDPKTAPYTYGLFASCRAASSTRSSENTFLLFIIVFPHTMCEAKTTAGFMYPHEYLHFSTVMTRQ
jgi:hypothetical protein